MVVRKTNAQKALRTGRALARVSRLHSIHYWTSMALLQDGFFYPHFPDKENESHQGLAVGPRSHGEPVAEPRFKSRQFASKIYVLNHIPCLPACLSKQGRETSLTPNFTSMLVALYKEKSAILVGDIHSFTQICAGRLQHVCSWVGQWGPGFRKSGLSTHLTGHVSAMNLKTISSSQNMSGV